jgi:peroxiredoxin
MKASTYQTACLIVILMGAWNAHAADPPTVRAILQPVADRQPAPAFVLTDAAGKRVRLSGYLGKVVLLDFWATECGGCRVEIPWFIELEQRYKDKGLAVVGVSMDILYENLKDSNEGWSRVKPFVRAHKVNYPILMGDDRVTRLYGIQALPVTYLIDKNGRIAATYAGLVDRNDADANIKTILAQP